MKVTIVGAGAVGGAAAEFIAQKDICEELCIFDIRKDFAKGKATDMSQMASLLGFYTKLSAPEDYSGTAGSDVAVITSGIPRKPGMTREELISTNAGIVKGCVEGILQYSPKAIIIIVSNPMDTMTYLALQASKLPKNQVFGMGGALDSARFKTNISNALGNVPQQDLQAQVIGGHGDTTMIPLSRLAMYQGVPIAQYLGADVISKVVSDTMVGGATLTGLLGTSAWSAPGAAIAMTVEAVLNDEKRQVPCSVYLDGEYGQKDICIGVPVIIGKNGWEKIIELPLNDDEKAAFQKSADAVRAMNSALPKA